VLPRPLDHLGTAGLLWNIAGGKLRLVASQPSKATRSAQFAVEVMNAWQSVIAASAKAGFVKRTGKVVVVTPPTVTKDVTDTVTCPIIVPASTTIAGQLNRSWINVAAFVAAVALTSISGWFSILGLTTIFAAAFWPVVVMGGTLEMGKLVTAAWLSRHWRSTGWPLKYTLTGMVVVLVGSRVRVCLDFSARRSTAAQQFPGGRADAATNLEPARSPSS
jgi:hypothetical protein